MYLTPMHLHSFDFISNLKYHGNLFLILVLKYNVLTKQPHWRAKVLKNKISLRPRVFAVNY
jgi:hypothetical protein